MVAYYHDNTLLHESEILQIMENQLLHTPDGVRDIYNGECKKKLYLQDKLHRTLLKYGYHDIMTPTFEFFNIFGSDVGTTPSKDLYKFFDKEGNTLVLRPDFTPSIARSAAKYYIEDDMPVKLCYLGNTFINSSDYQGRLKESTQCGAELIGDGSISADAEILSMTVESMLESGLKNFQISVGHSQFFYGLTKAAGLSGEQEENLRELIANKNFFGVEEFVDSLSMNDKLRKLFGLLDNFDLQDEQLMEASKLAKGYDEILSSIDTLLKLREYLKAYGIEKYISYELGLISDYTYYTGIIFQGYTYGTGEPIVKGGRYDKLLSHFGKDAAAIGFAIVVDQLMAALSRQDIDVPVIENSSLIVFEEAAYHAAIKRSMELRRDGVNTQMVLKDKNKTKEDYASFAVYNRIYRVEFIEEYKLSDDRYLTFALGMGRLAKKTLQLFEQIGITCEEMKDPDTRKLIFVNEELKLRFFLAKGPDVPTYVEYGAADIGVVGKDTILEEGRNIYEVLDLGFGKCRMCICGPESARELLQHHEQIRVATKYPHIAKDYFYNKKHQTVEIIKLNGSIELAPIVGLSEVICDIVETGTTLKENGLTVLEEVCPLSARVVVNQVSMKMDNERITKLISDLKTVIK